MVQIFGLSARLSQFQQYKRLNTKADDGQTTHDNWTLASSIQQLIQETNPLSVGTSPENSQLCASQTCKKSDHYLEPQSREPNNNPCSNPP